MVKIKNSNNDDSLAKTESPNNIAGGAASTTQASTPFTDFDGLMKHLPMYGERSLRELLKKKILPTIRPPGSRKLAFHLPSVDAAMMRFQRGGIE